MGNRGQDGNSQFRGFAETGGVKICPFPLLWLLAFTTACTNASLYFTMGQETSPTKLPILMEMGTQHPTNYLVPRGAPKSTVDVISSFHARDQGCSPKKRSGGRLKEDLEKDLQVHRILILLY